MCVEVSVVFKMADSTMVSLSYLSGEARAVVSRLDSKRLFPSEGPSLPRDYRGLANCIGVTAQDLASVQDKQTLWLIKTWLRRDETSSVVQELYRHLDKIDRYDIRDDLQALDRQQRLINSETALINVGSRVESQITTMSDSLDDLVTFEDMENGAPVIYDALVLYAHEDRVFVKTMMDRMASNGYKLCTKHSLRPGLTQYRSITQLIEARCRHVILVYSPDFFRSPDEDYFMDYVHALSIKEKRRLLLPCMYRQCQLPSHYSIYHNLYYESETYDFWEKLSSCLIGPRTPRITAPPASTARIQEITDSRHINGHTNRIPNGHAVTYTTQEPSTQTLALPDVPTATLSSSLTSLASRETRPATATTSLTDITNIKKKRSISGVFKKLFSSNKKNKSKQILVDYSA